MSDSCIKMIETIDDQLYDDDYDNSIKPVVSNLEFSRHTHRNCKWKKI